ncbi:MerR family transcriptional regulator [uncultured Brevibacillus sp.]|uniref:MerR family transcriptional regulator n=1 Tax=uncultured Brevibacillus sp. TaxID=169970 RepID=UPI00259A510E|nr:MerR family transcriptional regulator [uncultured Brevibacillus sp.]
MILIYTIGEFAKITKVSPRMLRHYDKIELLKPSFIEQNGYRYYSDEEIQKISMIKQFRRYGFSLEEIKSVLGKNDAEYTKKTLQLKIDYLQQSATEHHYLILELENQIRATSGEDTVFQPKQTFDIVIGHRSEFLALCQRRRTNEAAMDQMIIELYEILETSHLVMTGTHMTIFHVTNSVYDPEDADIEVCIPVNAVFKRGAFYTRIIEGGLYMSTIYIGSYEDINRPYQALIAWAKQNNYSIIGPSVERYYRDCGETSNQSEYVTEICIPIASYSNIGT